MKYRAWFALALVFFGLASGYLAWWNWMSVPPTPANALKEVSGTLLSAEDVSRSAGPVHPVLHLRIKANDGGMFAVDLRNRNVAQGQFRELTGKDVKARYSDETGVVYEFFAGGRQLVDYETSFQQEMEAYNTLRGAGKIAALAGTFFVLIGAFMLLRVTRRG